MTQLGKEYHADYQRRRYQERREAVRALIGGCCMRCGETEGLMDFDHIDPADKKMDISVMLSKYSWESILKELEVCQLLCRSCHIAKGIEDRETYTRDEYRAIIEKRKEPRAAAKKLADRKRLDRAKAKEREAKAMERKRAKYQRHLDQMEERAHQKAERRNRKSKE